MNATANTISAKIYQFKVRPRAGTRHDGSAEIVPLRPAPNALTYCAEISYHEAAIAEERHRKV